MRGKGELEGEFVEVESGRKDDRPQLAAALTLCRGKAGRVLVIAKLDRLTRSVAFISNLMESGVAFVAVDMPHANKLTMHVLAAVAEHKREMISQRTKAALAAAKARGTRLGNPRPDTARMRAAVAERVASFRSRGVADDPCLTGGGVLPAEDHGRAERPGDQSASRWSLASGGPTLISIGKANNRRPLSRSQISGETRLSLFRGKPAHDVFGVSPGILQDSYVDRGSLDARLERSA